MLFFSFSLLFDLRACDMAHEPRYVACVPCYLRAFCLSCSFCFSSSSSFFILWVFFFFFSSFFCGVVVTVAARTTLLSNFVVCYCGSGSGSAVELRLAACTAPAVPS